jgi:hypothetical protein
MPLETYYEARVTPTDDNDDGLRVRVKVTEYTAAERESIRAGIAELMADYPDWKLVEHFHNHNERISCRDLRIWTYHNGVASLADLEPEQT